ncbi:hypothetical protein JCM14108_2109 [Lentilactobacillus farraginis DSM 18382 = JCM 14108]|uniref:Diadenylate cyclase CdaA N-terminal domain-containing protein n=1 Tax=Lentilactobacillus farraginis DSM 18382 = JCM 14108 TaxID=1423743 RepID=X0PKD3_9LACO|nr:hypothetical protein JCM14108_2109 [Lentilactobacillus farraginis DSM 18382 = JCM 14108]
MNWSDLFTLHNLTNVIDILVVWFIIYNLILMVRGTKAVQLLRGIVIIALIKIISVYVGLSTVSWIMDQVINWGVIAMVIIFSQKSGEDWSTWAGAHCSLRAERKMKRLKS